MSHESIVYTIFLVFTGAAVLATAALYARQSLLVAYIALGVLMGPWGLGLTGDPENVSQIAHIGITFLLFLLGLDLQPQDLIRTVRSTTVVTLVSSLAFAALGAVITMAFGFGLRDSLLVGGTMAFSSTIIGLKLLPTTVLHHQRTGEIMISILLLQDLIAIGMLLLLRAAGQGELPVADVAGLLLGPPVLVLAAWALERYLYFPLIRRFDKIREYLFLMAIGWCLGMAQLGVALGLSAEIGAFIGGVALATRPVAAYIAESLRPLRDFFLVLFFFSLGAGFNLSMTGEVLLPAVLLAVAMLVIKPVVFARLLRRTGESPERSKEIGFRLGQLSEFTLLVVVLAASQGVLSERASYLAQLATLLTFIASSYFIVLRFPTPIAISDKLRRD
ncbi:MAG: cation:proton antiporter [Gammaproteobacteria bacterium]|jgi:Kef-type K+ transport system membrane component KefB|nr:cation:proton antiporter [Gammaproteobacteria bacterium]